MVQKGDSKRRGRPPAYDADTALQAALDAFWDGGYAATSLDDLSAATGMNRPSLYGAFGDKRELYLKAVERYREAGRAGLARALAPDRPLRDGLREVYSRAIALYLSGKSGPRGCFVIGTAATEAVGSPEVRALLAATLRDFDKAFEERMVLARERGELPADADPAALARVASAILHTLAVRARAGEKRAALEATAAAGLDLVCGPARPRSAARRPR
jgi:AcrR family transcriptional regulator